MARHPNTQRWEANPSGKRRELVKPVKMEEITQALKQMAGRSQGPRIRWLQCKVF